MPKWGMGSVIERNVSTGNVTSTTSGHFVLPSLEILPRLRARDQQLLGDMVFVVCAF